MNSILIKGAMTLLASIVLWGCSSKAPVNEEGAHKQILKISVGGSPQTIDQHLMTGTPAVYTVASLVENLVVFNYETFEIDPGVANEWTVSDDGLQYTFKLRPNAKWSNGEPLTASDFIYSWRRLLSPALGNQYANDYYNIVNAERFHKGELDDFSMVGVKAPDEQTVEFTLRKPDPIFLKRLASNVCGPVHPETIEKYGAIDDMSNPWTRAGNHVGNGPFRLVAWELNKLLKVEKNPYYWDADAVKLDEIHFNPAETDVIEERLYRAGQIDVSFLGRIPAEKIPYYRTERPDEIFPQVQYATYFYLFNVTAKPFDDVNVRRAFAYSVDRDLVVKAITKGGELPAHTLALPEGGYEPPSVNLFDPERARQFLAEAGYPNGEGFPVITLTYNTMDVHRKVAIALQQMWKKELNVDVQLENMEWKVFLSHRQNLEHQIARAGSGSSLLDPSDFLDTYTTDHGMNHTGWSNAEYDALTLKARSELDQDKRFALLKQAEAILLDELPLIPLYYYMNNYLKRPYVKNFEFNPAGHPRFKGVYLETAEDK